MFERLRLAVKKRQYENVNKQCQAVFYTGRTSCLGQVFKEPFIVAERVLYLPTGEIVRIDYK